MDSGNDLVWERSAAFRRPGAVTALIVCDGETRHVLSDDPFIEAGVDVLRVTGTSLAEAAVDSHAPDLVFMPVALDGRSARPLLDRILAAEPAPVVVVVATNDQINGAAEAMRAGAFDCLFRPFSNHRQARTLDAAIRALPGDAGLAQSAPTRPQRDRPRPTQIAAVPAAPAPPTCPIVYDSDEMRAVIDHLDAVAGSNAPVFLTGEMGSGKDLAARRVHDRSRRGRGMFVKVDCAGVSEDRFDREIAGKDGAFARAGGGTLYLHDICELDPAVQARLLRLIDSAAAQPARLVSATRHDAVGMVREGRLNPELYYRLHVAPVALPPLRARPGDVRAIAEMKLAEFARAEARGFTGIDEAAMARLEAHDWPGNVRELLNVVRAVVLFHDGAQVTAAMLPDDIRAPDRPDARARTRLDGFVGQTLDEIERAAIEATIDAEGGSVPRAARVLDVSPSTIYRKREAWARAHRRPGEA